MSDTNGFAVIGCPRCRRIMSADLSYETKTCQCGQKINLRKIKYLAVFESGAEAAAAVQQLQGHGNTGFTSAASFAKGIDLKK